MCFCWEATLYLHERGAHWILKSEGKLFLKMQSQVQFNKQFNHIMYFHKAHLFIPGFQHQKRERGKKKHICSIFFLIFPGGSNIKVSAYNSGDPGLVPGLGRSSGDGNGNPLQYSCLENPMDRGAQQATIHGVAKSQTQLSNLTFFIGSHWSSNSVLNQPISNL